MTEELIRTPDLVRQIVRVFCEVAAVVIRYDDVRPTGQRHGVDVRVPFVPPREVIGNVKVRDKAVPDRLQEVPAYGCCQRTRPPGVLLAQMVDGLGDDVLRRVDRVHTSLLIKRQQTEPVTQGPRVEDVGIQQHAMHPEEQPQSVTGVSSQILELAEGDQRGPLPLSSPPALGHHVFSCQSGMTTDAVGWEDPVPHHLHQRRP